jgi:hypothetical protein
LWRGNIDYAQTIKDYSDPPAEDARRYSPASWKGTEIKVLNGEPERSTSAKKVENLAHAVSLHYMHYNFARPHQTLTRKATRPTTPAMAAGVAEYPWSVTRIAGLLD